MAVVKPDVEIVVEATDQAVEQGYLTYVPIQWEQQRHKVWRAMVVHRWAALKVRQLAREQYAVDWSTMPGTQLWKWARWVGMKIWGKRTWW